MLLQIFMSVGDPVTQADLTAALLLVVKWSLVLLSGIYIALAVIISRQIGLMRATFTTPHTYRLSALSYVHLFCAVLLLLYFILFL